MEGRLRELVDRYPLGPGWEDPQPTLEALDVGGIELELVGLHSRGPDGQLITAGAAGLDGLALDRCYFELLERAAVLLASNGKLGDGIPLRDVSGASVREISVEILFPPPVPGSGRRFALSNAVAAHPDWATACRSARLEAIERDRVLRSWFGVSEPPARIDRIPASLASLGSRYDARVYRFDDSLDPESCIAVCGAFLLPRSPEEAACWGFAAGDSLQDATRRAETECLQRFGFLQGEAIPASPPELEATPDFHLDFFLYPPHQERVLRWLEGAPRVSGSMQATSNRGELLFADLTPAHLRQRVSVVKAVDCGRMPLVFGEGHPWIRNPPVEAIVHPVA